MMYTFDPKVNKSGTNHNKLPSVSGATWTTRTTGKLFIEFLKPIRDERFNVVLDDTSSQNTYMYLAWYQQRAFTIDLI